MDEPIKLNLTNCEINRTTYIYNSSDTYDFILTAKNGFVFKDEDKPTFESLRYGRDTFNTFALSDDKKKATLRQYIGESTSWVKIVAKAYEGAAPTTKVKVSTSLSNCTANSDLPTEVEVGQNLSVTLTADEGFIFDKSKSTPNFSYQNENLDYTSQNLTISEDGRTATGSIVMGDWKMFNIVGNAYIKPTPTPKVKVSTNLSNCTANSDLPTEVEVGQNLSVTLTANEGTKFDKSKSTPNFSYQNENLDYTSQNLTISEDGRTATGSIVMGDWKMFNIVGNAYIKPTPTPKVKVSTNLSNCTANSDLPTEVEVGQNLSVTLTANEGTKFDKSKSTPNFSYQNENLDFTSQNLTISEDGRTATGSIVMGDWSTFTINGEAYPVAVVGGKYGAVNVYLVTIDNLDEFSKKRYFRVTGTDPQTGAAIYENVDLGDYVNKIVRIYTPIKASSTDVIRCGNYNTNISCYQPETDKITLDFGNITIPNHNKNNVDFESELQLFLPFTGFVNISNEYVGKTINLRYVINIVTGNGSALISCDGVIFQVEETEPKNNVLYLSQNTESQTIGSDDWNERVFYGVEPYLLVKWFDSVGDGLNNDRKSGKIGSFTGFSRFDDIEPISTTEMLTDEQKQIYSLLNSGVYVI